MHSSILSSQLWKTDSISRYHEWIQPIRTMLAASFHKHSYSSTRISTPHKPETEKTVNATTKPSGRNPLQHVWNLNQHAVFQIWGANTNVGKSMISSGLMKAALLHETLNHVAYIKPVQTGALNENDAKNVISAASHPMVTWTSSKDFGLRGAVIVKSEKEKTLEYGTLFAFSDPVSPDLAAKKATTQKATESENLCHYIPTDHEVIARLESSLFGQTNANTAQQVMERFSLVETAGGVLSPGPQGLPQADVYRPLRLPAVLIADNKLGGISCTLSAYESLMLRGYDLPFIVIAKAQPHSDTGLPTLQNETSILSNIDRKQTELVILPSFPDFLQGFSTYANNKDNVVHFRALLAKLLAWSKMRVDALNQAATDGSRNFWWPFTQHANVSQVHVVDSASSDYLSRYEAPLAQLKPAIDGVGAWWTNGLGHGNSELARRVAAAAGRYGHVIFPETVHEPALQLSKLLLSGPGRSWASRVFYSDDGSTAIEIALKMAFRLRQRRLGLKPTNGTIKMTAPTTAMMVIGLANSYHGDTLGAMDCSPASIYNQSQTPWYIPRGIFLDPPCVQLKQGAWQVDIPKSMTSRGQHLDGVFELRDHVFDLEKREGSLLVHQVYSPYIQKVLDSHDPATMGALIIEPVLQGAGGMRLVDPWFQKILVEQCQQRKIPVVCDEIFTGLWRLGMERASEYLGVLPDIATYGKLLTAGTVPLAATLATEEVFDAFQGETSSQALLHGHSYTAHAIGCAAAVHALEAFTSDTNTNFDSGMMRMKEFWSLDFVNEISHFPLVQGVVSLGTVLAVELDPQYVTIKSRTYSDFSSLSASHGSKSLISVIVHELLQAGMFVRPLGNVLYMMCTPVTTAQERQLWQQCLYDVLQRVQ